VTAARRRVAVLGTGVVGRTLAERLTELGHDVVLGSRTATSDAVRTFAQAAAHGEVLVNATAGVASVEALSMAGARNLAGKPLLDVANALDGSAGFPPRVLASDSQSLAERIQAAFPAALVVKSLNTMTAAVMVRPRRLAGRHVNFMAGNDDGAKAVIGELLGEFGWEPDELVDLGDLSGARGMDLYLPLRLRIFQHLDDPMFNLSVARVPGS